MPTAHNSAKTGEFAKTVLMPGDPLRAKFIAETYLSDCTLVNNVRGIQGYTGSYKGKRVSVMASGMGMPSMGIYSYELFSFYNVDNIIRIGSAGAIRLDINVRDIVVGMGACTNSNYASQYKMPGAFVPICSYGLLEKVVEQCKLHNAVYHVGNLLSSDTFYNDDETATECWARMGVMAIEMEAAALYMNAARLNKNALAICTISDHILTGVELTAEERQNTFGQMMEVALDTAISL